MCLSLRLLGKEFIINFLGDLCFKSEHLLRLSLSFWCEEPSKSETVKFINCNLKYKLFASSSSCLQSHNINQEPVASRIQTLVVQPKVTYLRGDFGQATTP